MADIPGQWNKKSDEKWKYLCTNWASLQVEFDAHKGVSIETNGRWWVSKTAIDELVDALSHIRTEVYGPRESK
jgi:hypothetical protein